MSNFRPDLVVTSSGDGALVITKGYKIQDIK